jgi:hypothetical protein
MNYNTLHMTDCFLSWFIDVHSKPFSWSWNEIFENTLHRYIWSWIDSSIYTVRQHNAVGQCIVEKHQCLFDANLPTTTWQ